MRLPADWFTTKRLVCYPALAVVATGTMGFSWHVLPERRAEIDRQWRLELASKLAHQMHRHQPAAIAGTQAELNQLTQAQLDDLSALACLPAPMLMSRIFSVEGPVAYDHHVHRLVTAALNQLGSINVEPTWTLVSAGLDRVPEYAQADVLDHLARFALEAGNPALAAEIHSTAARLPSSTWQTTREAAESLRKMRKPAAALEAVSAWLEEHPDRPTTAERQSALLLRVQLALESGNAKQAFQFALDPLKELPSAARVPQALLDTAIHTAMITGASQELLPWIRKALANHPGSPGNWRAMLDQAKRTDEDHEDYVAHLHDAAQWADRLGMTAEACDFYFELAAAGDPAAIAPCMRLAAKHQRSAEFTQLLAGIESNHPQMQVKHLIFGDLARNGDARAAEAVIADHLRRLPSDREVQWERVHLMERNGRDADAIAALEELLRQFPGDAEARHHLARLRIRAGQLESALRELDQTLDSAFNLDLAADYASVAATLDHKPSLARAASLQLKLKDNPGVWDYLDAAQAAVDAGDARLAITFLRDGASQHPDSRKLEEVMAELNSTEPVEQILPAAPLAKAGGVEEPGTSPTPPAVPIE